MIKVVLCGAAGKMGKTIIREIVKTNDIQLVGAVEAPNNPAVGSDAGVLAGVGNLGVKVSSDLSETLRRSKPDVLIDFTVADAAVENVKTAAKHGVQVVVGTTGFGKEQMREIEEAVKKFGITAVISPNMSVGVNVLFDLVGRAAELLGREYSAEVIEIHHREKRDAPSGTALHIAEILAEKSGAEIVAEELPSRKENVIRVHSLRLGDVAGEHIVVFAGRGERLEIVHRAHGRETFAAGVLKAVKYAYEHRGTGRIYDMRDVLGLR